MTSGSANIRETSLDIGQSIHADFSWSRGVVDPASGYVADYYLLNPKGKDIRYGTSGRASGSDTLSYVVDQAGTWEALMFVWTGSTYLKYRDKIEVVDKMICIASIDPSSIFYTGPFNPGTKQLLTRFGMKNTGTHDCLFYAKFVEYPGLPNEKQLGGAWGRVVFGGETEFIDFRWNIPSGVKTWPVGVKLWWQDEHEPRWESANTRQWDIQVHVCTEGEEEVVEYCPDGSTPKKKRICENGKWVEYKYDCIECSEGSEEILEYCPDGHSPKRVRKCINGKWVEEDYTCPECSPDGSEEILEYCEYGGDVKRKRVCKAGKWMYYDYTCPECHEGESEILEYCDDGVNVKRERRCENGKWVEYSYRCPGEVGWLIGKIQEILSRFL